MKIFGSIQELVELVYRKGSNTVTLKPNESQANNVQFELPNITGTADTVVSVSSTAILRNKTINAAPGVDGNTVTNVPIASILPVAGTGNQVLMRDSSGNVINALISNSNIETPMAGSGIALTKLASVANSLRALQSDASGKIVSSSVTATELGHLSGVTSNIQTQLNAKVEGNTAIVGATATKITFDSKGLVTAGTALSASDLPSGIDATKIGAGSVDNTEFGYLNGLGSSAVGVSDSQTLLNKQISSTAAITGALTLPAGTEAQRPTPVEGMVRLNTDTDSFEGYANGVWSGIGGGGTTDRITQASHGFVVGDVLYLSGTTYTKAIATAANTAEVVGMVSRVIDASTFELTLSGEVSGLTGLTAGEVYFLSAATAGATTVTEPSTIGQVSVPVGVASSTTTMYVAPKRGVVVGGVNARTEVALTSGATTNIQNMAGYDAGELTGWVFISSASPVRFYVSIKVSKSGPGSDYNLSYQTSGDTPPSGFLIDITTTGMVRVTLPAASGTTSAINFALNAPAIGASFPLTVNANTILSGTVASARLPTLVKTQLKTLPSTIAGSNTPSAPNSNLSFNNLIPGRIYKVEAQFETDTGPGQIWFLWGSGSNTSHYRYFGTPTGIPGAVSFTFTAVNTTLSVYLGNSSANYRANDGNSTPSAITGGFPKVTWVQLSELSNAVETTDFT